MISRFLYLILAALSISPANAEGLPSAPTLALPEGLDAAFVVRTAKVQEMLAEFGVPGELLGKTPLKEGFNPLPGIADEHITSVVFGVGSDRAGDFCLISFTQDKTMDEVVKADGQNAGTETGDGDYRVITEKRTYSTSTRSYRRFSPREFLLTRNAKAGGPAQPAKVLSSLRAAAAQQNCLILAVMRGSAMSKKLPPDLADNNGALGDVVAGIMKPDGLRCFARVECASDQLAAQVAALVENLGPQKAIAADVPESVRPKVIIVSAGRTAALEATLPKASAGLGLAAFLQGMAGAREATAAAKSRRNAQSIAAVFNAGRAAGSAELAEVKSEIEAVGAVARGVTGAGQFSTATFKVQLTREEQEAAMAWLDWDEAGGILVYRGGQ